MIISLSGKFCKGNERNVKSKVRRIMRRTFVFLARRLVQSDYVLCLGAFLALDYGKLNLLPFVQIAKAIT